MLLSTTLRDAISDLVDSTIGTSATLEFQTSGDVEVATLTLGNPAFGASSSGTITLAGTPLSDTNATGGTMAKAAFKQGGTTIVLTLSVGPSASDSNFSGGVAVDPGDTVQLTSLTNTCPAS